MKLERRLIGLGIAVLLLGVALNFTLLLIYEQSTYRERLASDLKSRAEVLGLNSAAALAFRDHRAARENLATLRVSPSISLACLYDAEANLFASYSPDSAQCPPLGHAAEAEHIEYTETIREGSDVRGTILLQEKLPTLVQRLPRYGLSLVSSVGVEALLILVMVLALRARVLRPVDELARLAKRVTDERDYQHRVGVRGDDEIAALGTAVNGMLDAVEERQAALRESSRLLQNLIDHAPATITVRTTDGRFLLVNRQFAQLAGREANDLIGRKISELTDGPLAASLCLQEEEFAEGAMGLRHEETLNDSTWLCEQFPLKNSEGLTYAIASIATDITEQRATQASLARALANLTELNESLEERVAQRSSELERAMRQLVQSEKLAALGSLVAGVAHELNTPIGMVVTLSSSLNARVRDFVPLQRENRLTRRALDDFVVTIGEGMELIEKNSLRAGRLINDFKQVAIDQTSMRRRRFALAELVANTLHSLAPMFKHSRHHIVSRLDEDIDCDSFPGAIEQILTNLIQNALIHGLADKEEGRIEVLARRDGDKAVLSVCDDGKGIASEALRHIFEPFFTTRLGVGGSGLGLYIVHNLAHGVLGGSISAEGTEGVGACFHLAFPLVSPASEADLLRS